MNAPLIQGGLPPYLKYLAGYPLHLLAQVQQMIDAGKLAEKAPTKVLTTEPRHPYTKMLIGSLPQVGARYKDKPLSGIEGSPPSLLNPPAGCRFRDRCPLADSRCEQEPPVVEIAPRHTVACWKAA